MNWISIRLPGFFSVILKKKFCHDLQMDICVAHIWFIFRLIQIEVHWIRTASVQKGENGPDGARQALQFNVLGTQMRLFLCKCTEVELIDGFHLSIRLANGGTKTVSQKAPLPK